MRLKTSIAQIMRVDYDDKIVKFHKFDVHARKKKNFF